MCCIFEYTFIWLKNKAFLYLRTSFAWTEVMAGGKNQQTMLAHNNLGPMQNIVREHLN